MPPRSRGGTPPQQQEQQQQLAGEEAEAGEGEVVQGQPEAPVEEEVVEEEVVEEEEEDDEIDGEVGKSFLFSTDALGVSFTLVFFIFVGGGLKVMSANHFFFQPTLWAYLRPSFSLSLWGRFDGDVGKSFLFSTDALGVYAGWDGEGKKDDSALV
jgi:hypothetical protein